MTEFYLIRHGEPDWAYFKTKTNVGPYYGLCPLTKNGEHEIEESAKDPRLAGADLILASPFTRTEQTAQILSFALHVPVKTEYDLHEWYYRKEFYFEEMFPLTSKHIDDCYYHQYDNAPDPGNDNSETREDIRLRALSVLKRYTGYKKIIVACHEGVIRSLTGLEVVHTGQIVPFTLEE